MSEQYTITVPILGPDGEWTYPRVGEMSALRQEKSGEIIYDITLDFPTGATELVAFAQRSVPAKTGDHANTGPQVWPGAFPFPGRRSGKAV